jgi:hypothetical protein
MVRSFSTLAGVLLSVVTMVGLSAASVADSLHGLSNIEVIALKRGINEIPNLAGDGRAGIIVDAWRENMNAHGYALYEVLLPRPDVHDGRTGELNLVTFDTHGQVKGSAIQLDTIEDAPYGGELVVASVRFLRATLNGSPATLAVTARRSMIWSSSFTEMNPVRIAIYLLARNADGVPGWPYDYFDLVEAFTTKGKYCNTDLALARELGLPLPTDYAGANQEDGCIR